MEFICRIKVDQDLTKISCLNIRSLSKHLEDIKSDHAMLKSDIICLTETWVPPSELMDNMTFDFGIDGYNVFLNGVGKGKGVAIYAKPSFSHVCNLNGEGFQITKMSSENLDVICIYRSENGLVQDLFQQLCSILTPLKPTFICGDFNFLFLEKCKPR